MQFPDDFDLAEAITSPQTTINGKLEFDWYRDGSWAAPTGAADMTDLSALIKSVNIETATVVGDLPTDVNVVVGSSSGQLTLTLAGRRNAEEYTALQLFSNYFVSDNPLAGFRKEGTPVRYSRSVSTKSGFKTIRQFTGWIQRVTDMDEGTGEVKVICSDVYDLDGTPITLPRWAIGPGPDQDHPPVAHLVDFGNPFLFARMQPIATDWVANYLDTAAGRALGPAPKPDTAAFWSLRGSMIPTVGTFCDWAVQGHWISQESAFGPWATGRNGGLCPQLATGNNNGNTTRSVARSPQHYTVPQNAVSSDADKWTEISFWGYSDGTTTSTASASIGRFYMDSTSTQIPDDIGRVRVEHYRGGWSRLFVYESDDLGREWGWHLDTVQPEGWHYYSWIIHWTWHSISATLTVDDVPTAPDLTSGQVGSAFGYRYDNPLRSDGQEIGNQVAITCRTSMMDLMFRHSATAITYDPSQKDGTMRDGDVMVSSEASLTQLTYLPNRQNVSAWTLRKELAAAEMGVLLTDEFGKLQSLKRDTVWDLTGVDLDSIPELPRDVVSALTMDQSTDLYRNAVAFTTSFTQAIRAIVWQNQDAKHFYSPTDTPLQEDITLDPSVISITPGFNSLDNNDNPFPNGAPTDRVSVAAVNAENPDNVGFRSGWAANTIPHADQTTMTILWNAQSAAPMYIGACKGANQGGYWVGGTKMDEIKHGDFLYSDDAGVTAAGGTFVLEVPASDWMQSQDATVKLSSSLLRDLEQPAPVLTPVTVKADPRRQLLDLYWMRGGPMFGDSRVFVQIIGMTRKDDGGSQNATDTLTLRILKTPSRALWDTAGVGWDQGTWSA